MLGRLTQRKLLLALMVVVSLVLGWWLWPGTEPQYAGEPASQYVLSVLKANFLTTASATNQLLPMGAAVAVPAITTVLARKDSNWDHFYRSLHPRLPLALSKRLAAPAARSDQIVLNSTVALAVFGPDAQPAVPVLATSYQRAAGYIKPQIATYFMRLGPAADRAIPALLRTARNPAQPKDTSETRTSAVRALATIDPTGRKSANQLIPLLNDTNQNVAAVTVETLGVMAKSRPGLIPHLRAALRQPRLPVCVAAAQQLNQLAVLTRTDLQPFFERLKSTDTETRAFGAAVVLQSAEFVSEVAPAFVQAAFEPHGKIRDTAIESLEPVTRGKQVAIKHRLAAIQTVLQFGTATPGWRALDELEHLASGAGDRVPYLTVALTNPSERVRGRAAITLGRMGGSAKGALPALRLRLRDDWFNVREAATNAMRSIDPPTP